MKFSIKSLSFLMIAGTLTIASCHNDSSSTSTTMNDSSGSTDGKMNTMTDSGHTTAIANSNNSDQNFIDYAVPANTKEIAWLMAGMNKGTSKEVKGHAKMMLADHKKLAGEVTALITKKNLATPSVDTAGVVDINDKTGKDWDKAWADKMVADHTELLGKLNTSEAEVKDADLKTLITKTKPVVQSHLDMAKALQKKMK